MKCHEVYIIECMSLIPHVLQVSNSSIFRVKAWLKFVLKME